MDIWETIRIRCRRDGEKIKVVARELGLAPNTVRKYLRQDGPPKRAACPRPRLLDRYATHIDELIRSTPKITAVRVGSYLRQEIDSDSELASVHCENTSLHAALYLYRAKRLCEQLTLRVINRSLTSHRCQCGLPAWPSSFNCSSFD
jgi:hypothetical protein